MQVVFCRLVSPVFILPPFLPVLQKQARFQDFLSALHLQKQADFCMGSARTIRCSIWTLPFGKIRFSQFNTVSADIFTRCHFFSVRTEEMPEVIALDYVLIALNFPAKLCVFAFQIRCAELAANGFVFRKFLLQTGALCLEPCKQPVCCRTDTVDTGRSGNTSCMCLWKI